MKLQDLVNVRTLDALSEALMKAQQALRRVNLDIEDSLEVIKAEEAVFELWKIDPAVAQSLWEEHFTQAPKGITPSFIRRRALAEGLSV